MYFSSSLLNYILKSLKNFQYHNILSFKIGNVMIFDHISMVFLVFVFITDSAKAF